MRIGRPKKTIILSKEENEHLKSIVISRSPPTVQRIWNAFGLQPHRQRHFKISTDPFISEKQH